jgi:hypothetical protein
MSTCAICLDAIDVATTGCTTLSCKHEFHFSCISSWFLNTHNQSSCPCCRKVMTAMENLPEEEYEEAEANIRELFDLCRRCGYKGHFCTHCKATFDRLGNAIKK